MGARDAWQYAKLLEPDSLLPYLNLANLYGYYLNNLNKAEENYLAAVDRDPINKFGAYTSLAGFYRDFGYKESAIEYYQKVLEINPKDEPIRVELERLTGSN